MGWMVLKIRSDKNSSQESINNEDKLNIGDINYLRICKYLYIVIIFFQKSSYKFGVHFIIRKIRYSEQKMSSKFS